MKGEPWTCICNGLIYKKKVKGFENKVHFEYNCKDCKTRGRELFDFDDKHKIIGLDLA